MRQVNCFECVFRLSSASAYALQIMAHLIAAETLWILPTRNTTWKGKSLEQLPRKNSRWKIKDVFKRFFTLFVLLFFSFKKGTFKNEICVFQFVSFFFYYLWHVPAGMSRIITCKSTECGDKHLKQTHCLKLFTWSSLKSTRLLFHIIVIVISISANKAQGFVVVVVILWVKPTTPTPQGT